MILKVHRCSHLASKDERDPPKQHGFFLKAGRKIFSTGAGETER